MPARRPLSWPAPCMNGSSGVPVAHVERADALGPVELVRRRPRAGRRRARRPWSGSCRPTGPRRVCSSTPASRVMRRRSRRSAGSSRPRCWRASPRRGRSPAGCARATSSGSTRPGPVDGRRRSRRRRAARGSGRARAIAGCSTALVTMCGRSRADGLDDAREREVVRLGAAAGEDDLAGRAAEQRRRPGARAPRRPPPPARPPSACSTGCRSAHRGTAASPRAPRVRSGCWRCSRGRSHHRLFPRRRAPCRRPPSSPSARSSSCAACPCRSRPRSWRAHPCRCRRAAPRPCARSA